MLRRNKSGDLISRRGQTLRARLAGRGALQYQPDAAMPPRDSPEGRRKSEDEGRCAHARRVHGVWRGGVHIHRVRVSVRVCLYVCVCVGWQQGVRGKTGRAAASW